MCVPRIVGRCSGCARASSGKAMNLYRPSHRSASSWKSSTLMRIAAIDLIGRLIPQRLMWAFAVVKDEILGQSDHQFADRGVPLQIHVLVLDVAPQPFNKDSRLGILVAKGGIEPPPRRSLRADFQSSFPHAKKPHGFSREAPSLHSLCMTLRGAQRRGYLNRISETALPRSSR
jgi:hypothetical protein